MLSRAAAVTSSHPQLHRSKPCAAICGATCRAPPSPSAPFHPVLMTSAGTAPTTSTFSQGPAPAARSPAFPRPFACACTLAKPASHSASPRTHHRCRCPRDLLEKLAEDALRRAPPPPPPTSSPVLQVAPDLKPSPCTVFGRYAQGVLTCVRVRELVKGVWDLYASFVTLSDNCIDLSVSRYARWLHPTSRAPHITKHA